MQQRCAVLDARTTLQQVLERLAGLDAAVPDQLRGGRRLLRPWRAPAARPRTALPGAGAFSEPVLAALRRRLTAHSRAARRMSATSSGGRAVPAVREQS